MKRIYLCIFIFVLVSKGKGQITLKFTSEDEQLRYGIETLGFKYHDSEIFTLGLNFEYYNRMNDPFGYDLGYDSYLIVRLGMNYFFQKDNIKIDTDIKSMTSRFFYVGLGLQDDIFYLGSDIGFFNNSILYDNTKFSIRPKIGLNFDYFETGISYFFVFGNKDNLQMYPNLYIKFDFISSIIFFIELFRK